MEKELELIFIENLMTEEYTDLEVISSTEEDSNEVYLEKETIDDWIDLK